MVMSTNMEEFFYLVNHDSRFTLLIHLIVILFSVIIEYEVYIDCNEIFPTICSCLITCYIVCLPSDLGLSMSHDQTLCFFHMYSFAWIIIFWAESCSLKKVSLLCKKTHFPFRSEGHGLFFPEFIYKYLFCVITCK